MLADSSTAATEASPVKHAKQRTSHMRTMQCRTFFSERGLLFVLRRHVRNGYKQQFIILKTRFIIFPRPVSHHQRETRRAGRPAWGLNDAARRFPCTDSPTARKQDGRFVLLIDMMNATRKQTGSEKSMEPFSSKGASRLDVTACATLLQRLPASTVRYRFTCRISASDGSGRMPFTAYPRLVRLRFIRANDDVARPVSVGRVSKEKKTVSVPALCSEPKWSESSSAGMCLDFFAGSYSRRSVPTSVAASPPSRQGGASGGCSILLRNRREQKVAIRSQNHGTFSPQAL